MQTLSTITKADFNGSRSSQIRVTSQPGQPHQVTLVKPPKRYIVAKTRLIRGRFVRKVHGRTDSLETAKQAATKIMGAVEDTRTGEVWTANNPYFIPRFISVAEHCPDPDFAPEAA